MSTGASTVGTAHPGDRLRFSRFTSIRDNRPKQYEASWPQLIEAFAGEPPTYADKLDSQAFSPAVFSPGSNRTAGSVESISFLVFDLDKVPRTVFDAIWTRTSGLDSVIYTTHGHHAARAVGLGNYRVVLRLSRPVLASEWDRFWSAAAAMYAPHADPACRDAPRVYFPPCIPPGTRSTFEFLPRSGAAVDVDALLGAGAVTPRKPLAKTTPAGATPPRAVPWGSGTIPSGQRNSTMASIAGSMRRRGADEDEIRAQLDVENARCDPPLPSSELDNIARSIARYAAEAHEPPAWADPPDRAELLRRVHGARGPGPLVVRHRLAEGLPLKPRELDDALAYLAPLYSDVRGEDVARAWVVSVAGAPHFAERWEQATWIARAATARRNEHTARLAAARAAAQAAELMPILQLDDRFLILDERPGRISTYLGPYRATAVPATAKEVWPNRPTETPMGDGSKPMTASMLVDLYGTTFDRLFTDYTICRPLWDRNARTMTRPPSLSDPALPVFDTEVDAWLHVLDPSGRLHNWITWCLRLDATACALVLLGGAHVGKSLLAAGVARARGSKAAVSLSRALGRFRYALARSPVVFGDEGIPRGDGNRPLTQEFRALVTEMDHDVELKGSDREVVVHGGLRVILAANNAQRLFPGGRGDLNAHDVEAIVRRLLVIELHDPAQIDRAARLAVGLGTHEGDPARLARVAGHFAWLMANSAAAREPTPDPGSVQRELRLGSDDAKAALAAIEEAVAAGADWITVDEPRGLWVQFARLGLSLGVGGKSVKPEVLRRKLEPYVRGECRTRTHPVTGASGPKIRWTELDLNALRADGVDV